MSNKNLSIILLSGVLTFSTAPYALSQTNYQKSDKSATQAQKKDASQKVTKQTKPAGTSKTTQRPPVVKQGSLQSKDAVCKVQQALMDKGFDPGPIDGVMGAKTRKALADFQSTNNLTASGQIDPQTEIALGTYVVPTEDTEREKPSATVPDEFNVPPIKQDLPYEFDHPMGTLDEPIHQSRSQTPTPTQSTATSVADVRQLQMALKNRGYDPGEINGMVGSDTQSAIRQFQASNSLAVTGIFDSRTQTELGVTPATSAAQTDLELSAQASQKQAGTDIVRTKPSDVNVENQKPLTDRTMDSATMDISRVDGKNANAKNDNMKIDRDVRERLEKASEVLQEMTKATDKRIPEELLQRAQAIAVIPHMVKGAFGIGGRYGKGMVSRRMDNGRWSAPSFVSIGGGSFGAQLGVTAQDLVLVFTDKDAVRTLEKGTSFKLGIDAGVVAGPLGRTGEAGVTQDLKSGILAYSRAKGLFAGVALDGAVLDMDGDTNHEVYGANADVKSILNNPTMAANSTVRSFVTTLERTASKRISEKQ